MKSKKENFETMIYMIRDQKFIFDCDLAKIYKVKTKFLNRIVKRNKERFPIDFMFQLTMEECKILRPIKRLGKRSRPYAYTVNGVAMLTFILNSDEANHLSISLIRNFTKLRSFLMLDANNEIFKFVFEELDC